MKLMDIPSELGLTTIRDGAFSALGLISSDTEDLLVFLENDQYVRELFTNRKIRCVIVPSRLVQSVPPQLAVAVADDPRAAFYHLHNHLADSGFYWKPFHTQIASSARIHPRAFVAETDVRIGERCVVEPHATILERTVLEDDVIVRANAVIGSEGFQFAAVGGQLLPVVHAGGVRICHGAEIQSGTCVDKAIFGGFTEIGEDTKVDNLVHVAHNARLGKRNRVVAGAMIAGSVRTGDDVWIGPMVSISHELEVGDGATLTMGAVVTKAVPAGGRVTGNFAIDHERFIAFMRSIR